MAIFPSEDIFNSHYFVLLLTYYKLPNIVVVKVIAFLSHQIPCSYFKWNIARKGQAIAFPPPATPPHLKLQWWQKDHLWNGNNLNHKPYIMLRAIQSCTKCQLYPTFCCCLIFTFISPLSFFTYIEIVEIFRNLTYTSWMDY